MTEISVICDSSETCSGIPGQLGLVPGIRIECHDLDIGDYLVGDQTIIERKTAHEFAASIHDRRLFAQIEMMQSDHDLTVILIEGDVFATRSLIDPVAIEDALSWMITRSSARVLFSGNARQSASMIASLARHHQQAPGGHQSMRGSKPISTRGSVITRYILEGLPGVGAATAIALARHFESVQSVANASLDELLTVKGIGSDTAMKVFQSMRGNTATPVDGQ